MRELTVMPAAVPTIERPKLRPFVVDDQGDMYLVCAPDKKSAEAVAVERRTTNNRTGDGVCITEIPMTLEAS